MFKVGDKVKRKSEYLFGFFKDSNQIYTVKEYIQKLEHVKLYEDYRNWDSWKFELVKSKSYLPEYL